ncbi:MAG: LamG-like jellyroll fold domain-containing protein [Bacteroidota bacterium]
MKSTKFFFVFIFFWPLISFAQVDSTITLTFDFNEHTIKEKDNKVIPRPEGVTLTYDRFGNENSALYLHGHLTSYINLGTSNLLKSSNMSISTWINIERRVYSGKGFDENPVFVVKNGPGDDFINAISVAYDCNNNRLFANSTKDSTEEVFIYSNKPFFFNQWYHLFVACNNNSLSFYVNGEFQGKSEKKFETKFMESDSLVFGHTASFKNERYTLGIFDDIKIFHRSLSEKEIIDLYNAPNPNKLKNILNGIIKYGVIILVLVCVIIIINIRNKKALKRQKEQLELVNKITELELKVVKTQMNPHFISNCLAAIQELIYKNDIDKAGQYIAKFSYFLRQVLNYSDKNYISLAEEIEIIILNVELEQLRFKNEFSFEIHADEKIPIKEILIPSLITQPFIENAIWHGLLPLGNIRKPALKVNVFIHEGLPIIEIEDNGVGRDSEKPNTKMSKGTKLVSDKIESLNKLNQTTNYKMEIIDLFDDNKRMGTRIRIQLDNI